MFPVSFLEKVFVLQDVEIRSPVCLSHAPHGINTSGQNFN